jgi:hypothetical protein
MLDCLSKEHRRVSLHLTQHVSCFSPRLNLDSVLPACAFGAPFQCSLHKLCSATSGGPSSLSKGQEGQKQSDGGDWDECFQLVAADWLLSCHPTSLACK